MSKSLIGREPWNKNTIGLQMAWNKGLRLENGELPPQTEESNKKRSETLKKRFKDGHHSKGVEPWNKGKKGLQEAWNKGKEMEKVECPHCGKICDKLNAKKWHFEKCKKVNEE